MTTGPIPICESCSRLGPGPDGGFACSAFPQGIPDKIYVDGFDHRRPFKGDNGVRFNLARGKTAGERFAAYLRSVANR